MSQSKKVKDIMGRYEKVLREVERIEYGARSLGKVDKDVKDIANMALLSLQGQIEAARFHVTSKRPQLKSDWATKLTRDVLDAVLTTIDGDGHSVFNPSSLAKAGLPRSVVRRFVDIYPSDIRNPKATMFDSKGRVMSHVRGIYGLDILRALSSSLGAASSSALGRGFEARELTDNIRKKLNELFPA